MNRRHYKFKNFKTMKKAIILIMLLVGIMSLANSQKVTYKVTGAAMSLGNNGHFDEATQWYESTATSITRDITTGSISIYIPAVPAVEGSLSEIGHSATLEKTEHYKATKYIGAVKGIEGDIIKSWNCIDDDKIKCILKLKGDNILIIQYPDLINAYRYEKE
jgi:hypothetical protein